MKNAKNAALMGKVHSAPMYTIDDADRAIHFVGTAAEWPYCEEHLRAAKVVGIDSETRPVFNGKRKANPCSLLQLAVRCAKGKREVFVLDLLKLKPKLYNAALSKMFLSKQTIKLGQGLMGDLKDLVASYPAASCFSVAKAVVEVNDLSISLGGAHHAISLQKLAFFYLNKRLTKTMQTSNWNRRPLSTSQLHYAASDALVLIDIYDELVKRLQAQHHGKFKLESIMQVLDVHVEQTPKCTLCFEVFEAPDKLKKHRKECSKAVRTLSLCANCDEMLLLDAAAMETHTATCGSASAIDAETDSPMEVSDLVVNAAGSRKRPRAESTTSATTTIAIAAVSATVTASGETLSKRKRKNNKKKTKSHSSAPQTPPPSRARKMSVGTLLAADDIWSEISCNLVSDQPSP